MEIITAKYADTEQTAIIVNDELIVPIDPANRHYAAVLEWVDAGNTIAPYVAPPIPDAASATVNQLLEELSSRGLEDSLFSAMTPAQQRRFLGAKEVPKDHPLTVEFLTAQGFTYADITDLFNKAAKR